MPRPKVVRISTWAESARWVFATRSITPHASGPEPSTIMDVGLGTRFEVLPLCGHRTPPAALLRTSTSGSSPSVAEEKRTFGELSVCTVQGRVVALAVLLREYLPVDRPAPARGPDVGLRRTVHLGYQGPASDTKPQSSRPRAPPAREPGSCPRQASGRWFGSSLGSLFRDVSSATASMAAAAPVAIGRRNEHCYGPSSGR